MTEHIFKRYAGAISLMALLFLLLGSGPALGARYKVVPLSYEGQWDSRAFAINNSGVVTGYFRVIPEGGFMPLERGFIWDETGGMKEIAMLHEGDNYCMGYDINDSGQVAGESGFDQWGSKTPWGGVWNGIALTDLGEVTSVNALNNNGHVVGEKSSEIGFVWKDGTMTALANPWSEGGVLPNDINDAGYMVGKALDSAGNDQAFVWDGTIMTGLGFFGGTKSEAMGINNSGHVVGSASDENGVDCAFLWNGEKKEKLATLGGKSYAYAVNGSDQVVGESYLAGTQASRAVIWDDNGIKELQTLISLKQQWEGWKFDMPTDINDSGWITGYGMLGEDKIAFVLKPEISQSIGGIVSTDLPGYNMPVTGVTVSLDGTDFSVATDENGRFLLENVPVGTYTLIFTAEGFSTKKIAGLQLEEADDILISHDDGLISPPLAGDTGGNGKLDLGDAFNALEDVAGM